MTTTKDAQGFGLWPNESKIYTAVKTDPYNNTLLSSEIDLALDT